MTKVIDCTKTVADHDAEIQRILAKIKTIEDDPKNLNTQGSFTKYKPYYGRKIDDLRRTIAHHMRAKRLLLGQPVNDEGYSGRQTNRR